MQEKLTFRLPWQLIKFSSLDLIHMVVRGLLKEHYCKAFVKIPKTDRNKGLLSLFPIINLWKLNIAIATKTQRNNNKNTIYVEDNNTNIYAKFQLHLLRKGFFFLKI